MNNNIKNVKLEVLRGLACLVVIIAHIRITTNYFPSPKYDFLQLFTAWGREAVIIFFILSGIVINISTKSGANSRNYYIKRLARLFPIYLFAIAFSACIYIIINREAEPLFKITGNILMIQSEPGYITSPMRFDPALWSISCEAFFYLIFGFILKIKQKGITVWLILSLVCVVLYMQGITSSLKIIDHIIYMMYYSFIWVLGYILYQNRERLDVSLPTAILSLSLTPLLTRIHAGSFEIIFLKNHLQALSLIPFFIFLISKKSESIKRYTIPYIAVFAVYILISFYFYENTRSTNFNRLLYIVLPLVSLLFFIKGTINAIRYVYVKVQKPLIFVASISYALYLLHMPLMFLFNYILPGNMFLGMLSVFLSLFTLSYLLELKLQPAISKRIKLLLN